MMAVLILDQVTKAVAGATLHMAWLDFTLNHRTGWGLIHLPMHYIAMITALGLLMVGLFGWRMVVTRQLSPFLLGLVIGGGTGNLIDRLAVGAVRDFLVGPWETVFNLADRAIVVGAIGWAISARVSAYRTPTSNALSL